MDEAVELAQHVVRNVPRGARLAVQIDRNLGVPEADLLDELPQVQHRGVELGPRRELLVVDRQHESGGARLLLRELRQVAIARHPEDLHPFLLDRRSEGAYAEPRRVLGAEVFVDDDDRKPEFHRVERRPLSGGTRWARRVPMSVGPKFTWRCRMKARIMGRFDTGGYEKCRSGAGSR